MLQTKKWLSVLLVCALLVSLFVGCGSTDTKSSKTTEDTEKKTSVKESESKDNDTDTTESPEDLVTLTVLGQDKAATVDGTQIYFSDWEEDGAKTWMYLKDRLAEHGVALDMELIMEDQYPTAVQTQLAAGLEYDLANMSPLDVQTRLNLVNQGKFQSISAIWEEYSQGPAREFFETGNGSTARKLTTLEDGNVYWLTDITVGDYQGQAKGAALAFQIRKDWLDKLELPVPTTLDEVYDTLVAFQEQDVNGNGRADEVISVGYDDFGNDIAQWFGLGTALTYVIDETGEVVSPWHHDNVKDYISFMKRLVDGGLLDTSDQGSQKKAENSIAGISTWATQTWEEVGVIPPEGEAPPYYQPILVHAVEGTDPVLRSQRGHQNSNAAFVVTDTCQEPEAVARLLDYLVSPEYSELTEWGLEDYTFTREADGSKTFITEGNSEIRLLSALPALWTNGSIFPRYEIVVDREQELASIVEAGVQAGIEGGYQEKRNFMEMAYQYEYTTPVGAEDDFAVPTLEELERISDIRPDLKTYSDELLTKLILGQQSLEDWDSYLDDLERLGLAELIEINQGRYSRGKDN